MNIELEPTKPRVGQLIAHLRRRIAAIDLPPGSALSEKDIAAQFNVSRQPLRETFIKLSKACLVEIRPSRGTWVVNISVRKVCKARFVREAIETYLAPQAARPAEPQHLSRLQDLIDQQRSTAERGDFASFSRLDETFHGAIAIGLGNDFARRIVETARFLTNRVRLLSLPDATSMNVPSDQHQAIVDGMAQKDQDGTEAAMRRHLREILLALPSIATAHPDHFADTALPESALAMMPRDTLGADAG